MLNSRTRLTLLLPASLIFILFLIVPLILVLKESLLPFVPGRVGGVEDGSYTLDNYLELLHPAYLSFFFHTYLLAFIGATLAILISFPIAYYITRQATENVRKALVASLVGLLFLSALVRIFSIQVTFGSVGLSAAIAPLIGINVNGNAYTNFVVICGLLHYEIPLSILILLGPVLSVNPKLPEAARSLGASRLESHLSVTVPLCSKGLASAFLVCMTFGVSAFVIPWILGRGRVSFISNLIYSRFTDLANYPSGAAISMIMLVLSGMLLLIFSKVATRLDRS